MDNCPSTAVLFSLSVFLLQMGRGEHIETTEGGGLLDTTNDIEDKDVYTGWSTAGPLNTDVWDSATPIAVTDTDTDRTNYLSTTHVMPDSTTHVMPDSTISHKRIKSNTSTDLSDIHFKPKHTIDFEKSIIHQEAPHNPLNTNALEQFIKGEPVEYEEKYRKHSSINPSPYPVSHPSKTSQEHTHVLSDHRNYANGSRTLLPKITDPLANDVTTAKSVINDSIHGVGDLGKGYTTSLQEEISTEATNPLSEIAFSKQTHIEDFEGSNSVDMDRINILKSQVHSRTQDDDGEYEYEELVSETEDGSESDGVTQGNIFAKINNQTENSKETIGEKFSTQNNETVNQEKETPKSSESASENADNVSKDDKNEQDDSDSEVDDGTYWYYSDNDTSDSSEAGNDYNGDDYYTDVDYDDDSEDSQDYYGNTVGDDKWAHEKEHERHIPVKSDTAYTSVLEDPGPLGEIKTLTHGESLTRHQPVPKQSGHDSSLPILVFYTWIGVVTVMVIGAFIALKQRHRIANYVWDHRTGYRKSETVFATEEGRNLLLHQHV